jgi:hypothetical protein
VGQRRQYLGRQLEPWSMERGDVAPVPVAIVRIMTGIAVLNQRRSLGFARGTVELRKEETLHVLTCSC